MNPSVSIDLMRPPIMVCPGGNPANPGPGGGGAVGEIMWVEWDGKAFIVNVKLRCTCCSYPPIVQQVYDRKSRSTKWVRFNPAKGEVEP